MRVLAAEREDGGGPRLTVETDRQIEGCHECYVLAVLHGRREHLLYDAPFGHRRVRVAWRKQVWRCLEPACAMVTFTALHAPRAAAGAADPPGRYVLRRYVLSCAAWRGQLPAGALVGPLRTVAGLVMSSVSAER